MAPALAGTWRLLLTLVHLLHGVLVCAAVFPFLKGDARLHRVQWWCRRMLSHVGVAVVVQGAARGGGTLRVANHVSWLDILVMNAVSPARFVSKSDVRRWPVLGWLVACGGTLFIERERKRDALRVVHQVAQALQEGDTIAVFPEGTTGDGRAVLPFHANLLQAAIAVEAPVQPVVLRYSDAQARFSEAVPYVGEMTLLQSIWRTVTARGLTAHVQWLPAEGSRHADRRALAERLQGQIEAVLTASSDP